jgi:Ca2+-binding RTX toxin-like protein
VLTRLARCVWLPLMVLVIVLAVLVRAGGDASAPARAQTVPTATEGATAGVVVAPAPLPPPRPADRPTWTPTAAGDKGEGAAQSAETLAVEPDCLGATITINGTEGDDTITGTESADVIHGQGGNDDIHGGGGSDIICGGDGNDSVNGDAGDDTLDGGSGDDGLGGGDGNDTLSGGDGNDGLSGGPGDDTIDGGPGWEWLYYYSAPGPVTLDLGAGTAIGEGNDTLTGIEGVMGSAFDDVLKAGPSGSTLGGVGGNDTLVGGDGRDEVGFWWAPGPVTADLVSGTATGEGNDTLTSIEDLMGSVNYGDLLAGDGNNNSLGGSGGDDSLDGGPGTDYLDGGPDTDTCLNAETAVSCEQPPPSISGVVTDPGGSPIAGASVSASPYSETGTYGSTATGPDGTYIIAAIAAGSYRVQACATGYICEYYDDHLLWEDADPVAAIEGSNTPSINFSLRVGGTISGTVTDSEGTPIGNAWLLACPFSGETCLSATSAPDGTYTIAALATDSYLVQAQAEGYVAEYYDDHLLQDDADPVPVTEGANTPNINFSLRTGGTISGTVTDPAGNPIANASIGAFSGLLGVYGSYSSTGPDGTYTIGGLPTGSYSVQACATGYVCEYYDDHPIGDGADPVGVTEGADTPNINFSLSVEGTISGVVTDPGGNPMGNAMVTVCTFLSNDFCFGRSTALDGTYTIGGLPTGSYRVEACATGYACEYYDDHAFREDADPVPVTEGANTPNVNFRLSVGGTISGVVIDPGGNPIPGASIAAESYTGSGTYEWVYGWATTGPDGTYGVGRLGPASYRVRACAMGYVCEYYNDHLLREDADPVVVTEASDTPGINFSLRVEGAVGGIAELPVLAGTSAEGVGGAAEGSGWSARGYTALTGGLAAALLGPTVGAWYARRRWLR